MLYFHENTRELLILHHRVSAAPRHEAIRFDWPSLANCLRYVVEISMVRQNKDVGIGATSKPPPLMRNDWKVIIVIILPKLQRRLPCPNVYVRSILIPTQLSRPTSRCKPRNKDNPNLASLLPFALGIFLLPRRLRNPRQSWPVSTELFEVAVACTSHKIRV